MIRVWLLAALASACTHDAPPAKPPAAPAPDPAVKTADDVLGFLPGDAQVVLALDGHALRASAMYPEFRDELVARLRAVADKPQWDCLHLETLERLTVGLRVDGDRHGVFVLREPGAARLLHCIASTSGDGSHTATLEGGVLHGNGPAGKFVATAVGDSTLVVETGSNASSISLAGVLASGAPLRSSAWFRSAFEHLEANAAVWAVVDGRISVLHHGGVSASEVDATVVVTDKVAITGRAAFADPETASQLAAALEGQLAQVRPFVERVDVTAQGPVVRLEAAITAQQIRQLMMLLKMAG